VKNRLKKKGFCARKGIKGKRGGGQGSRDHQAKNQNERDAANDHGVTGGLEKKKKKKKENHHTQKQKKTTFG